MTTPTRLKFLSFIAKLLGIQFKVNGHPYGSDSFSVFSETKE